MVHHGAKSRGKLASSRVRKLKQRRQLAFPSLDGLAHFFEVARSVVYSGYAADLPADVIEEPFDHVRRNAHFRHTGGDRTTNVVDDPVGIDAGFLIECCFGLAPIIEAGEREVLL